MNSRFTVPLRTFALFAAIGFAGISSLHAQTIRTWSSTPADGDWNDTANWTGSVIPVNGDRVTFGASSVTTLNNDLSGLTLTSTSATLADSAMYFTSASPGYTINGNDLTLHNSFTTGGASVIRNESTAAHTFATNLSLTTSASGQNVTIVTRGNLLFTGTVSVGPSATLQVSMGSTTPRNVTFDGAVTLSTSNTKGMTIGGGLSNPGGIYTFNSTITKTGSGSAPITVNSGTVNVNGATDLGTGTKTLAILGNSGIVAPSATVNLNHVGGFDEIGQIDIFQTAVGATGGSTGTASLLVGANGWNSMANISIGTNAHVGASFVVGGKSGLGATGIATYGGNITALDSNEDQPRTITATAEEGRVNFNGVISRASGSTTVLSVTKTGNGIVALAGSNTYTGNTLVSAGTLLLNNTAGSATGTGALNVNGGKLAGFGSTGSISTIANGARITAGNIASGASTPTLDTGVQGNNSLAFTQSLTINGAYDWYLGANSESVGFSQLDVGTTLTLGATSSFTLTAANFLGGVNPDGGNLFWNSDRTWVIANAGTLSGNFGSADLGTWSSGSFALSLTGGDGNDLALTWTAVPEPSSAVLMAISLCVGMLAFRRRSRAL